MGLTRRYELDEQQDSSADGQKGRKQSPSGTSLQEPRGHNVGGDLGGCRQEAVHEGVAAEVGSVQG